MLKGVVADVFKIFLSDANVMLVFIVAMISTTLLIMITDFLRGGRNDGFI